MVNKHVRITFKSIETNSNVLGIYNVICVQHCDTTKHRFMNKSTDMSRKNIQF